MEVAKHLRKESIPTLPESELQSGLVMMHEAGAQFPPGVRSALVSLQASELLAAAEHSNAALLKLIEFLKPWSTPSSAVVWSPVDRSTWRLATLTDITEKARIDWFLQTTASNFMLPLLEKGEAKAHLLKSACQALAATWDADALGIDLSLTSESLMSAALRSGDASRSSSPWTWRS